jgi:hypothetical protein
MRDSPEIHSAPLLVLANKQDLPGAIRAEEIATSSKRVPLLSYPWS